MKCTPQNANPRIAAILGTGTVALTTMAFCPLLLPVSILAFVPLYKLARSNPNREMDHIARTQADRLAETWKRSRSPRERGITVSASVQRGKGLLAETVIRTYHYELEDDEL